MGFGETDAGEWNPLEDFRWADEFVLFLNQIDRMSQNRVTLVLAGDTFELWQSDTPDCRAAAPTLGCSEDEAVARIKRILTAHRVELQALGTFASHPANRLIFIPGNHDAAILYPRVWEQILKSLRCDACASVTLERRGYWVSPGARIYVEHGHQADRANSFPGWPVPFGADANGTARLQSPFGERLVREFFDRYEAKYPVVDNISGYTGVLQAMKFEGIAGSAAAAAEFAKLLVIQTSWRQLTSFLASSKKPPEWNLAASNSDPLPFLLASIPPDDSDGRILADILNANATTLAPAMTLVKTSDDDLSAICESRYITAVEQESVSLPVPKRQTLCDRKDGELGYLTAKAINKLRGYDVDLYQHINEVLRSPAVAGLQGRLIYVYGHTHSAMPPFTPSWPALSNVTVLNTGAWHRLVSGQTASVKFPADDAVKRMAMSDLPPCYSFVWVKFHPTDALDPHLFYWSLDREKHVWGFADSCEERERLPR